MGKSYMYLPSNPVVVLRGFHLCCGQTSLSHFGAFCPFGRCGLLSPNFPLSKSCSSNCPLFSYVGISCRTFILATNTAYLTRDFLPRGKVIAGCEEWRKISTARQYFFS